MTDIVERLRRTASLGIVDGGLMDEAAEEIERLRQALVDVDELVDYADADDGQPNLAMRIMSMVRAVLEKA